jgi:hypothetical protein
MEYQEVLFNLSTDDIDELSSRVVPEEPVSLDSFNVDEIIRRLTPAEKYICDDLHASDETDVTMNRFLAEVAEIKERCGFLGEVALSELTRRYLPRITHDEITPRDRRPVAQQIVLRKKNTSNNAPPKTERFRTRQQPNQLFRGR